MLIRRLATENRWRARKIQSELERLGFTVSLATVSRHLPRGGLNHPQRQSWRTFLCNHRDGIAGMDFFVVPTVRFQVLSVWFAIDHSRRRIQRFHVTPSPTAAWVLQRLRETFPHDCAPHDLIYDKDSIFP